MHPVKRVTQKEKTQKGWVGENRDFSCKPLKSTFFDKHMILPYVPSGHFALGNLSGTCLKDATFGVCVRQHKSTNNGNICKYQILHDNRKSHRN